MMRSTIEVAHFRFLVSDRRASSTQNRRNVNVVSKNDVFVYLGPWDFSSGSNLIFAEVICRMIYGPPQVRSLGKIKVDQNASDEFHESENENPPTRQLGGLYMTRPNHKTVEVRLVVTLLVGDGDWIRIALKNSAFFFLENFEIEFWLFLAADLSVLQ